MQIVKVNKNSVLLAGRILRAGGVIVYPTDTAYALGGVFDNAKVIKRILAIKQRKDDKFTLIALSQYQVEKFFTLNAIAKKLAKKYWPGPLSVVVSKKYAVRVPDSAVARKLARLAGKPLIATSANIHGEKTPYGTREIMKYDRNSEMLPDLILDAGTLKKRKASTIFEVSRGKIIVIREGAIKIKI